MELSSSNTEKDFFTFRETETLKKLLIFQETELSYISETSYISGSNFPSSENEKN